MEQNEITTGSKQQLPVRYCWNCEKGFDAYEETINGKVAVEDRFCSTECYSEWNNLPQQS